MSSRQQTLTGLDAPAHHAAAVTPHDSNDLTNDARGLYVGGDGNIVLITTGGNEVTFSNAKAGSILPIRTARVKATGTTATNLVALW